jgi:hypothetical protein
MENIVFITEQYIKDNSEIQDTIDIKKVLRTASIVQNTYIVKLLGSTLMSELQTKVQNGTVNDSGVWETLYKVYIKPIMLNYCLFKSAPFLNYTISNKGIVQKTGDNARGVELSEVKFLANSWKEDADALAQQCILYLLGKYEEGYFTNYSCQYNEKIYEVNATVDSNYPYLFGGIYLG